MIDRDARILWSLIVEADAAHADEFINEFDDAAHAMEFVKGSDSWPYPDDTGISDAILRWRAALSRQAPDAVNEVKRTMALFGSMTVVIPGDENWPAARLWRLEHPPVCLYAWGYANLLTSRTVALTGARAATGYGEQVAMELAGGLADREITVVSGGAYGIDASAHRAALAATGSTIAVLSGGLDRLTPAGNVELLYAVGATGLVVSEAPPGTMPTRARFLQRNRIIAALSDAVVIVEAGYRSGSMNTAIQAQALHVPVGAVPGPVTSPTSAGCHRLIREGIARFRLGC